MTKTVLFAKDPEQTTKLGRILGARLVSGALIALRGDLGAGKTTFTQGLAQGLDVPEDTPVVSPSFALAHEYSGRLDLYHLDLYRLEADDFFDSGLDEFFERPGVTVVEWAEKIDGYLPEPRLEIELQSLPAGGRQITIKSFGGVFDELVQLAAEDFSTASSN